MNYLGKNKFEESNTDKIYNQNYNQIKIQADKQLKEDLIKLLESEAFADLTISTANEEALCHTFVLKSRAPSFFKLLRNSPGFTCGGKISFLLKTQGLTQALRHIYTGSDGGGMGENFMIGTLLLASSPSPDKDNEIMEFGALTQSRAVPTHRSQNFEGPAPPSADTDSPKLRSDEPTLPASETFSRIKAPFPDPLPLTENSDIKPPPKTMRNRTHSHRHPEHSENNDQNWVTSPVANHANPSADDLWRDYTEGFRTDDHGDGSLQKCINPLISRQLPLSLPIEPERNLERSIAINDSTATSTLYHTPPSPANPSGSLFWVGIEPGGHVTKGSVTPPVDSMPRRSDRLGLIKSRGRQRRGKSVGTSASSSAGSGEDSFWIPIDDAEGQQPSPSTSPEIGFKKVKSRARAVASRTDADPVTTLESLVKGIGEMNERLVAGPGSPVHDLQSGPRTGSISGQKNTFKFDKPPGTSSPRGPVGSTGKRSAKTLTKPIFSKDDVDPEDTKSNYEYQLDPDSSDCSALGRDLIKLLNSDTSDPDVTLLAEGNPIKAHKCILAIRSPYFSMILENDPKIKVIELPGASYKSALAIIRYIYGAIISFEPGTKLAEITFLAHKYGLSELHQAAQLTLSRDLHFFHKPCQGCLFNLVKLLPDIQLYNLTTLLELIYSWNLRYLDKFWTSNIFITTVATDHHYLEAQYKFTTSKTDKENVLPIINACRKVSNKLSHTKRNQQILETATALENYCKEFVKINFCDIIQSSYLERLLRKPSKSTDNTIIGSKFIMDLAQNVDLNADSALNILNRSEGLYKACLENMTTCSNPDQKRGHHASEPKFQRQRKLSLCENREPSSPNLLFLTKLIEITNNYLMDDEGQREKRTEPAALTSCNLKNHNQRHTTSGKLKGNANQKENNAKAYLLGEQNRKSMGRGDIRSTTKTQAKFGEGKSFIPSEMVNLRHLNPSQISSYRDRVGAVVKSDKLRKSFSVNKSNS